MATEESQSGTYPDERGAIIVDEDGMSVTFDGNVGDLPLFAPAMLGLFSEYATANDVSAGDVLATFPPGDLDSLDLAVGQDGQQTLTESVP